MAKLHEVPPMLGCVESSCPRPTTLTMCRQARRFPERLRRCQVRCCGALARHFGDVVVDPADIDDMDPRLGRQIAIVEHRHRGAILVGGSEQVGAPNPFDTPHVGRAASPRQPNSDDTVPTTRSQSCREWPSSPEAGEARCLVPVGALGFVHPQHGSPEIKISGEPTGNSQMGSQPLRRHSRRGREPVGPRASSSIVPARCCCQRVAQSSISDHG